MLYMDPCLLGNSSSIEKDNAVFVSGSVVIHSEDFTTGRECAAFVPPSAFTIFARPHVGMAC
jgi:hypothetical protein